MIRNFTFYFIALLTALSQVFNAQDITGDWKGVWQREDSLHIILHIYRDNDRLKAAFDSPDQGEFGVKLNKVIFSGDTLFYSHFGYTISYKGKVNQDYSRIVGDYSVGSEIKKLNFTRKKFTGIDKSSLTVIPAKIFGPFPIKSQKIPYNGITIVEAGIPIEIEIDFSTLNVSTPGKGAALNPLVYELSELGPIDENTKTEYYTKYAPVVVKARQSRPIAAQPMHINENASFNIQYLDMEQGLMDGDIWSIMEDSRGNIWFGSLLSGICRYDGRSLTYYTIKEGLTNNTVKAIMEDSKGNIWIGTDWGLCKYDGSYFVQYSGELFKGVESIMETRNGNIWVGTHYGAFAKKGDTWTHYTEDEGLSYNKVLSIHEDKQGNIWFGTGSGICKFDGVSFTDFTPFFFHHENEAIVEDPSGNLWFGTSLGICKFDGKSFYLFMNNEGLSSILINSAIIDKNGHFWFGNWEDGVNIYDEKSFTHLTFREGLTNNIINSIIEDKNKNIWLATYGSGIMKIQRNSFTYLNQFEDIGKGKVNSIIEDRNGNMWFGIFGVGLVKFNGEFFIKIEDKGRYYSGIQSIIEGHDGNIWFANNMDFQKYDGESTTIYYDTQVSRLPQIVCIYKDNQGNMWLGTSGGGIKKFDGKSFTRFLGINSSQSQEYITCILKDKIENLWYGTINYGLFKYNGDSTIQYTIKEGLSSNWISSLFEDETGNLWIGTSGGGINKFDGQSFISFTEKEGLSTDFVSSVIGDKKGNIWVGTKEGLSLLSPQGDGNYSITTFGTEDGLKDLNFNNNSVCLDSKNHLWWGTGDEVTILDLNTFEIVSKPPVIQLNNIFLNQKFIDFRTLIAETEESKNSPSDTSSRMKMRGLKFSDVAPFYNYPLNLQVPHYLNHMTFDFSAIDWSMPQSIKYQYMIEGLDEQWSLLSTENMADYRNIPSGKYKFKVKALNKANLWSETIEYPFVVRPPLWFRWWAFTIYALAFILLARYYIKYIISRERIKAEVQIKQVEVDKMQELDHMKSRFFANISHEFRTPLTLLTGPINDLLRKKDSLEESDRKLLGIMKRNAARLHQLINQLLDLSKLETGNLKLKVSEGNLTGFVRTIILSFLSLAESKKIHYEYDLEDIPDPCFYDEDKVEKILTNLVANALKFTPEGGSVIVTLRYNPDKDIVSVHHAEIKVKDTGPGIPDSEKEKIFGRFYQVSSSDSRKYEGSGIGLALARELVQLYRGEIHVDSEVGVGSTFTLVLPVSREQFREEEIIAVSEEPIEPKSPEDHKIMEEETADEDFRIRAVKEKEKDKSVILIVEDNADLRKYISQNLLSYYQIIEAENGKDGLDKSIEYIPDLVISDLMMPELDGVEMCSLLKKDPRTSHIPLIMLTAKADRDSKLESLETGADDYIIKPFDAEELQVRVKNLIEQRKKLRERYRKEFLADPAIHEIPSPEDELLARVMDCLKEHLAESEFNVEHLGKELGLSRSQLYRKILALTDHSPNELIRNMRLKMAARMFLEGYKNITTVLYTTGFSSPSYFTKSFRRLFGVIPSDYIRLNEKTLESKN